MKRKTANIDIRLEPRLIERIDAWRTDSECCRAEPLGSVHMIEEFLEHDPPGSITLWKGLLNKA